MFQNYNLMPNLTALENIQFLAELVPDPMDAKEALPAAGGAETRKLGSCILPVWSCIARPGKDMI